MLDSAIHRSGTFLSNSKRRATCTDAADSTCSSTQSSRSAAAALRATSAIAGATDRVRVTGSVQAASSSALAPGGPFRTSTPTVATAASDTPTATTFAPVRMAAT